MKQLNIAVGIIRNAQNEIFITRRNADVHMGGKLEFPGGKVEQGESAEQALVRELREEVGITAKSFSLYQQIEHQFSDRLVAISFFLVSAWDGEPWGKEGQSGQWLACSQLDAAQFPPANEPVIARLLQLN